MLRSVAGTVSQVFATILIALALNAPLYGQATGSPQSITGVVRDPSGAVVPGATVTARNSDTGVETARVTTEAGTFTFPGLAVGTYQIIVSAQGFQKVVRDNVRVLLGTSPDVTIELRVGTSSQKVTVSGVTQPLDTTSTTTGLTRSTQELAALPVQVSGGNRDPIQYLATFPGVVVTPSNVSDAKIQGVGDNGGYGSVVSYKIDGVNSNFFGIATLDNGNGVTGAYRPAPDLVQEVRLVTNTNAEDGWNLGVSFELVTKSGTNSYHGSAYEYLRNDALDARNFFATNRPVEKQHDFGVIFGGPIKKDKHFFLASYSGYRQRFAIGGQLLQVPTAKMKTGDFTQFLGSQLTYADGTSVTDELGRPVYQGEIYDPTTTRSDGHGGFIRDPFTYNGQMNVIDPSRLSKISGFFQQGLPSPNFGLGGTGLNFNTTALPSFTDADNLYVKTDHDFGRQRLSLAYEHVFRNGYPKPGNVFGNAWEGFGPVINATTVNASPVYRPRINYSWTVHPNLLFGVHAGMAYRPRRITTEGPVATGGRQAGLTGTFTQGTPSVSISGVTGFGVGFQTLSPAYFTGDVNVDLTWVKGSHQFKFGYQVMELGVKLYSGAFTNGSFSFDGSFTGLPDLGFAVDPATGLATQKQLAGGELQPGVGYADYWIGYVGSANVRSAVAQRYSSFQHAWYAQDQWRLTPKLTFNFGLRYDVFQASREEHDRIGNFCAACPNPGANGIPGALAFFGNGAGRNGRSRVLNTYPWSFEPRLGIAYQFNKKTVGRLYYGVQRYPMAALYDSGRGTANYGWGAILSKSSLGPTQPAFIWDNGTFTLPTLPNLDPGLLNGSGVGYINPQDNKPPIAHSLGVSVERQLWGGLVLHAEYAGKLMHDLPTNNIVTLNSIPFADAQKYGQLLNQDVNSPAAQAAGIPIPYPGFSGPVYQALRPFPQFQAINEIGATIKNVYWHSGQFSLQKQFGDLAVLAAFTITKSLTNDPYYVTLDQSSNVGPTSVQYTTMRDAYWPDVGPESGRSGDRPKQLIVSYAYQLPVGHGKRFLGSASPILNGFLGGWQISGIQSYLDGVSFPISSSVSIPTFGPIWPVRVKGQPLGTGVSCGSYDPANPAKNQYLNPGAFTNPAPFQLGDTLVPNIRSCGYLNEDLSLSKTLSFYERYRLKFGVDFFNAFNRHSFYSLSTTPTLTNTYGHYSSVNNPRSIQLHMNLDF